MLKKLKGNILGEHIWCYILKLTMPCWLSSISVRTAGYREIYRCGAALVILSMLRWRVANKDIDNNKGVPDRSTVAAHQMKWQGSWQVVVKDLDYIGQEAPLSAVCLPWTHALFLQARLTPARWPKITPPLGATIPTRIVCHQRTKSGGPRDQILPCF